MGSEKCLEKKLNNERERIISKVANFSIGSLFSAAGTIFGGKIAWYGIQSSDDKSVYIGTALLAGGISATVYCFNKIRKGWRALKPFYYQN